MDCDYRRRTVWPLIKRKSISGYIRRSINRRVGVRRTDASIRNNGRVQGYKQSLYGRSKEKKCFFFKLFLENYIIYVYNTEKLFCVLISRSARFPPAGSIGRPRKDPRDSASISYSMDFIQQQLIIQHATYIYTSTALLQKRRISNLFCVLRACSGII